MKFFNALVFISCIFFTQGQEDPYCKTDSTKMITFCLESLTIRYCYDDNGDLKPRDYDSVRYDLYDPDRLVICVEGENKTCGSSTSGRINNMFITRIKTPDNYLFTGPSPDSIDKFDENKINAFIEKHKDSLQIDTLTTLNQYVYPDVNMNLNIVYRCTYKFNLKHGDEFYYYSIPELKNNRIEDNFKLKSHGRWKHGKKHGKWIEYDKSGKIISITKYKSDKLVKAGYP
jgi:hypothetical protein